MDNSNYLYHQRSVYGEPGVSLFISIAVTLYGIKGISNLMNSGSIILNYSVRALWPLSYRTEAPAL